MSIKQLLENTKEGETVYIPAGVYDDTWNVYVKRNIKIRGLDRPLFIGNGKSRFCKFSNIDVDISGIDFQNFKGHKATLDVHSLKAQEVKINSCNFKDCQTSIWIAGYKTPYKVIKLDNLVIESCSKHGLDITAPYSTIYINSIYLNKCEKGGIYIRPKDETNGTIYVDKIILHNIWGDKSMQGIVALGKIVYIQNVQSKDCGIRVKAKHWSDDCSIYARADIYALIKNCHLQNASGIAIKGHANPVTKKLGYAEVINNFIYTTLLPYTDATKWACTGIGSVGKSVNVQNNQLDGCIPKLATHGEPHYFVNNGIKNSPYPYSISETSPHIDYNDWQLSKNKVDFKEQPRRWVKNT